MSQKGPAPYYKVINNLLGLETRPLTLLSGTGGVSIIALLMCIAAGIRPIITSSSDEKLKALQKQFPEVLGINYKTTSDHGAEVKRHTNGRGVDFVINNSGPQSILDDIGFLCERGGTVSLVGFLQGFEANWEPSKIMALMSKAAKIKYALSMLLHRTLTCQLIAYHIGELPWALKRTLKR
jgi:NADPH:quinone reductase-like Zn-dependent oxidoreductase